MDSTGLLILFVILLIVMYNPLDMYEEVCHDDVTYISTLNGITVKYDKDSNVVTCKGD